MQTEFKQKKNFCILITLCLIIVITSCSHNGAVNDAETGEIQNGELKYTYIDGIYRTVSEYYNNDGYAYAMKISIENGVLSSVSFDMFDCNLNRFSLNKNESTANLSEVFRADVKALTNELLQQQTSFKIYKDEDYTYAFKILANQTLESAKTGNNEITVTDLKEEYYKKYTNPETNITSNLKVIYAYGEISDLEFTQNNEFNATITNYNYNDYREISMSYKDLMIYLNEIPQDKLTLKKDNPTDYPLIEINDYNILCDMINSTRKLFAVNYNSVFSSL